MQFLHLYFQDSRVHETDVPKSGLVPTQQQEETFMRPSDGPPLPPLQGDQPM